MDPGRSFSGPGLDLIYFDLLRSKTGAGGALLLVLVSVIMDAVAGASCSLNRSDSEQDWIYIMTTATPKQEGKVIVSMLKDYEKLVGDNSKKAYGFISAHKEVVQRDIEATLKAGQATGTVSGIRPTYSKQFSLAGYVIELLGADKLPASVEVFMTGVEVFHRAYGAKESVIEASRFTDWAKFEKAGRLKATKNKAQKDKDKADKGMTGASQGNAKGKRGAGAGDSVPVVEGTQLVPASIMAGEIVIPDNASSIVTIGVALRFFSNRLDSAVDVSLTGDEIALALKVSKRLASLAKVAGSTHPAKGSKTIVETLEGVKA